VHGINGNDINKVVQAISDADLMATAVGVNVLKFIAKPIAKGLSMRWQSGNDTPLNIIICENLLDANIYLGKLIENELDANEIARFNSLVGLVEASIGRMVPVMTAEMQKDNILRVCTEEYDKLPVDKDAFKGDIPNIKGMMPASPFEFYIQRKLYIHNMGHALTAYIGSLKGYTYIWEAIEDTAIRSAVLKSMQDTALALSKEHNVGLSDLLAHVEDLILRFGSKKLGDTARRVGNDTKRKLSPGDRLAGAANLCVKHSIAPNYICLGMAAAMKFDVIYGNAESEVAKLMKDVGIEGVLKEICVVNEDGIIWKLVIKYYDSIDKGMEVDHILGKV
jgi:mannitol-1-phosphate 5-dehydrogenase